jgi:nucleoside-triphosphatase THEP1
LQILITGPPRSGKSTLISTVVSQLSRIGYVISGFFTPEVRLNQNRIGFDIKDIKSGKNFTLSRIGNLKSSYQVGKYQVDIASFEEYLADNLNVEEGDSDLLVIDEIGKMELGSKVFIDLLYHWFQSEMNIVASIGQNLHHPVVNCIHHREHVLEYSINVENRDIILDTILSHFSR